MNNLRQLRERRLMTQGELAEAVGVSRYQTVARWESGTDRPRPAHLRKLCEVLGVTPDELRAALQPVATLSLEQVSRGNWTPTDLAEAVKDVLPESGLRAIVCELVG